MDVSTRTVLAVLAIAGALAFALFQRAQSAALSGPPPEGARYRVGGGGGAGTLELKVPLREGTFTFAPQVAASDRELVLEAVASSRPEARRLVAMVDGLVDVSVGSAGSGAAGRTMIGGARYPVTLDLGAAWERGRSAP